MKAQWDNVGLGTFIDICVEEVNANNRGKKAHSQTYNNLIRKFFERTRREYTRKQFFVWKTLTQKASDIGFDPVTKTVIANDEW